MYSKLDGQSRQVRTRRGTAEHRVHHVGPLPILRHFLDRMAFSRIVGSCLGTVREAPNHAQTLGVLVQNILLSPSPLYRIAEWTAPFSAAALGLTPAEKGSINDDRMARTLDALVSVSARSLFFRMALHVIKQFEIDTGRIHHDTTTVTFHGQYATSRAEPRITQGINKDHRPDLKQLVFGLNVSADGAVPLSHEVHSGNRTDDTIHRSNVDYLRQLLGRDDFIYVADCKLATRKNLQHIDRYGGKFVSVLPRTRAEDQLFRRRLREGLRARWRLADLYGEEAFLRAANRALEYRRFNAEAVRRILEREHPLPQNPPPILPLSASARAHALLDEVDPGSLDGYHDLDIADSTVSASSPKAPDQPSAPDTRTDPEDDPHDA